MPLDKGRVDRRNSYKKLQRKTREKGKKKGSKLIQGGVIQPRLWV